MEIIPILIIGWWVARVLQLLYYSYMIKKWFAARVMQEVIIVMCTITNVTYLLWSVIWFINKGGEYIFSFGSLSLAAAAFLYWVITLAIMICIDGNNKHR